jgi:hypothetical protein
MKYRVEGQVKYRIEMKAHMELTFSRPLTEEELQSLYTSKYPDNTALLALEPIVVDVSDDLLDVGIVNIVQVAG